MTGSCQKPKTANPSGTPNPPPSTSRRVGTGTGFLVAGAGAITGIRYILAGSARCLASPSLVSCGHCLQPATNRTAHIGTWTSSAVHVTRAARGGACVMTVWGACCTGERRQRVSLRSPAAPHRTRHRPTRLTLLGRCRLAPVCVCAAQSHGRPSTPTEGPGRPSCPRRGCTLGR